MSPMWLVLLLALLQACLEPASAFMLGRPAHTRVVVGVHKHKTPAAASTMPPGHEPGPWGLGRLLGRFRKSFSRRNTDYTADASSTFTWTIEVGSQTGIDGEEGAIYVSPLFTVGRFDFRLVAAAAAAKKHDLASLGLYLEHFPSSSLAAVPSVKCRLRWSQVSKGEMVFEHSFDDPLASSMLAGKAGLIPLPGVNADVRVEATVTLSGVHFPSSMDLAALEAAAWEQLLCEMETLGSSTMENDYKEGVKLTGEELESMRLFGCSSVEEGN